MKRYLLTLLIGAFALMGRADEGMWLLQLLEQQHTIDMMKKAGLRLEASDIYSATDASIKDAVGIFGGGCTGEVISKEGLILTNHHCGYSYLQQLSTVDNDYLKNGFWTHSKSEELPVPGLTFTFVESITDMTEIISRDIKNGRKDEIQVLSNTYLDSVAQSWFRTSIYYGKTGYHVELLPYFAGNSYYLVLYREYGDVRLVAAPPTSIGKFGGETDNWMWPRHTGDFSLFRIYADDGNNPTDGYDAANTPLQPKKYLSISTRGFEEDDYAMVIGFPGSTDRYLTSGEVRFRMDSENTPRIAIREARQAVLKEFMNSSDSLRIMYANKYASSSNYWKNSIGMNKAIINNKIIEKKLEQEVRFAEYAESVGNEEYKSVVDRINSFVSKQTDVSYNATLFAEAYLTGLEFSLLRKITSEGYHVMGMLYDIVERKRMPTAAELNEIESVYQSIHNKDYSHAVDKAVANELIYLYYSLLKEDTVGWIEIYDIIADKYKKDCSKYIDNLYDNSIFSSRSNLDKFLRKPSYKVLAKDPLYIHTKALSDTRQNIVIALFADNDVLELAHKTYVRGLTEMNTKAAADKGLMAPQYPDANFTQRLTYSNIKSYSPADGVQYNYYTTLAGVIAKEDTTNNEFIVPEELKTLYAGKDYGRYANKKGEMPVCFLTTADITGGNSGSPVLDADGYLIGTAFDGNWESLSGDIEFDPALQRCIAVDIRYILFIIDKFGNCPNLISEMDIVN